MKKDCLAFRRAEVALAVACFVIYLRVCGV